MGKYDKSSVLAVMVSYYPEQNVLEHARMLKDQVDHLLVVDNTPTAVCPEPVESLDGEAWVTTIRLRENKGIAAALNVGLAYAIEHGYPWLLTMDQDSCVAPDHVRDLLAGFDRYARQERVGQISPLARLQNGFLVQEKMGASVGGLKEIVVSMASGTLVRTAAAQAVGGFEASLFIGYVDIEFSLRLRRNGYVNLQSDAVIMRHSLGYSGKRRRFLWRSVYVTNYPPVRVYYQTRNRIYLARYYFFSDTAYVLRDFVKFVFFPLKVLLYEENKWAKLAAVARGFVAGVAFAVRARG